MKKQITKNQLEAIVNLKQNPLIDHVSISAHKSGNIAITIAPEIDASQDGVDDLLKLIFPTMLYVGTPFQPQSENGISTTLYGIDVKEERVSITLHLKKTLQIEKAPLPEGAVEEINHLNCIIDPSKVESLIDFPLTDRERYLEFHESNDDLAYAGGDF